jgi:hypothetical protein
MVRYQPVFAFCSPTTIEDGHDDDEKFAGIEQIGHILLFIFIFISSFLSWVHLEPARCVGRPLGPQVRCPARR